MTSQIFPSFLLWLLLFSPCLGRASSPQIINIPILRVQEGYDPPPILQKRTLRHRGNDSPRFHSYWVAGTVWRILQAPQLWIFESPCVVPQTILRLSDLPGLAGLRKQIYSCYFQCEDTDWNQQREKWHAGKSRGDQMQREQHVQRPRGSSGKESHKNFFLINVPLLELRVCSIVGQEWGVGDQVTQTLGHRLEGMQGREAPHDPTPVNTGPSRNEFHSSHFFVFQSLFSA